MIAHREGVAQIVDSRSPSMLIESLRLPQADALAYLGEVVAGAAVGRSAPGLEQEERLLLGPEESVAFVAVGDQPFCRGIGQRNHAGAPVLAPFDGQGPLLQVHMPCIERQGFADPQPRGRDQAE
jgi:hypothetical protein